MRVTRRALAVAVMLVVVAGAVAWYELGLFWSPDDTTALSRERLHRRALFAARGVLPATPDLSTLDGRLAGQGLALGAPVLIRIFKREFELELWMQKGDRFERFATYPICNFSGALGPKLLEGDRQSPEGFYSVDAKALNPNSRWPKSFNLGFPNTFDRAHQRTGTYLMVHGGCSSVGCYAMTDPVIDEIWRLVTAAIEAGQPRFQVQVYPFRMTENALAEREQSLWIGFWRELKSGHDAFEASGRPPRVQVCGGRYVFRTWNDKSTPMRDGCKAGCRVLIEPPSSRTSAAVGFSAYSTLPRASITITASQTRYKKMSSPMPRLGPRLGHRIGMLTPSSNTVLEPMTYAMLPPDGSATAHFARFKVTEIALSGAALGQFDAAPILAAAELLAHAKCDVIAWNGTSASWLGFERDEALVAQIEAATGIRAATCVLGYRELFRKLGARRIGLVTPYTGDVQARIASNWASSGFTCTAERHCGLADNFSFAEVDEPTIERMIRAVVADGCDAVAIVCTNMRAARIAARLEPELGLPILDSVAVTLWAALRAASAPTTPYAAWGRLFAL